MTADAAVGGIRSVDPTGEIGVISAEQNPPYNRPPLSKGLWKGEPVDTIWRKTTGQNVTVHPGCTVTCLIRARSESPIRTATVTRGKSCFWPWVVHRGDSIWRGRSHLLSNLRGLSTTSGLD